MKPSHFKNKDLAYIGFYVSIWYDEDIKGNGWRLIETKGNDDHTRNKK